MRSVNIVMPICYYFESLITTGRGGRDYWKAGGAGGGGGVISYQCQIMSYSSSAGIVLTVLFYFIKYPNGPYNCVQIGISHDEFFLMPGVLIFPYVLHVHPVRETTRVYSTPPPPLRPPSRPHTPRGNPANSRFDGTTGPG